MKRRLVIGISALAAVLLAVALAGFGLGSAAGAQDGDTATHPLVGTWIVDADLESDTDIPEVFAFSADGTFTQIDGEGSPLLGVWEATGDSTGIVTLAAFESDDAGNLAGAVMIRAAIEIAAGGQSFTAEYTLEVIFPDGSATGEAGPGTVEGQRLEVQEPGEPVMTIDELFASIEGGTN